MKVRKKVLAPVEVMYLTFGIGLGIVLVNLVPAFNYLLLGVGLMVLGVLLVGTQHH